MKKFHHVLVAALFGLIALSASGCITDECGREGLTVYTNNWGENGGQDYMSVCAAGYWFDTPVDVTDDIIILKSKFEGCPTIGCYKNGIEDCECLDTYPRKNNRD